MNPNVLLPLFLPQNKKQKQNQLACEITSGVTEAFFWCMGADFIYSLATASFSTFILRWPFDAEPEHIPTKDYCPGLNVRFCSRVLCNHGGSFRAVNFVRC